MGQNTVRVKNYKRKEILMYSMKRRMRSLVRILVADSRGQDLIEYALVVALIAFAAAAGMSSVATQINAAFTNIGAKVTTYTS